MPSSVLLATLVAAPAAPLSDARIDGAALALGGVEHRRRLDEGRAADLVVAGRLAYAYRATPEAAAAAACAEHSALTALLYAQGVARSAFAEN